ncbi:MAG: hypothetical protein ACRDOH_03115 [Streptosporangiaceae bacterium]
MRLRSHRRNLVVWSSSAVPAGKSADLRGTRPARTRRIRWWLRTGALLMVIGVLRLARTMRTRWEPMSLLAGTLLMVVGFTLPAVAAGVFLPGLLVLIVTLLKGIREQERRRDPVG